MAVLVDKPWDIPRFYAGDLHEEGGHEVYICELLGILSVPRGRTLEERAVKLLKEFFLSLRKPGDVSVDGKLSEETKIRIAEPLGHLKIVLLALLTESEVPVVVQKEALNTLMELINPKLGQHFDNDLYFRLLKAFILSSQPSNAVLDMLALTINQHSHMRYFTCLNVLKLASDLDCNKGKYQQGNDQQPTISMGSCQTLYHLLSAVASGLHKGCMMICACSQGVSEGLKKHMEVEAILLEGLRALMQLPLPVNVHEMMRAFLEDVESNNRVDEPDLSSSVTPCMVQKMVSFNWGLSAATLEHNGEGKMDASEEKVGDEEGSGEYEEEEEEGVDEEQGGNEEEGEEEEDEDGAGQDGDEDGEDNQEEEDEEEYEEEDEEEDEDEDEEEEDDENEEETEPPKKKKK